MDPKWWSGGCDVNVQSMFDIFILDVPTMSWTQGKSASEKDARCNMACTVRGDYFIVWGGKLDHFTLSFATLH